VLTSAYDVPAVQVTEVLSSFLASGGLMGEEGMLPVSALTQTAEQNVDSVDALVDCGSVTRSGQMGRRRICAQIPSAALFSLIWASMPATASFAFVSTASLPPVTPGRSSVTSLTRFGAPVTNGTGFTCT
jgi:hypothetical protein